MFGRWSDADSQNFVEGWKSVWPEYVERGVERIYGEYRPESQIKAFEKRWGDLELATFRRVLQEGQEEDRVLAISVLGESSLAQDLDLLRPFLHSPHINECIMAALTLGAHKDAEALPVLVKLLNEEFPTPENSDGDHHQDHVGGRRIDIAVTLQKWNDRSLIPIFRQALVTIVQAEISVPTDRPWLRYQEILLLALGRWGVFGALTGLPLSPERLQFAVVLLAAGFCIEGYYIVPQIADYLWSIDEQVKERMMSILGDYFGLSRDEQELYLRNFPENADPGGFFIVFKDPLMEEE